MSTYTFATLRLGKTSVEDIKKIDASPLGVQTSSFKIDVVCTQVPMELCVGVFVFMWLGSDNSKGIPTSWKQGFKAFGKVINLKRGGSFNDESTISVDILYIFPNAINRLDILREAPQSYYWCSSLPIIGLDDHSNQTVRMMDPAIERCDIKAFFNVLELSEKNFKKDMLSIEPGFIDLFNFTILDPRHYGNLGHNPFSNSPIRELNRFADFVFKTLNNYDSLKSLGRNLVNKEAWIWFEDSAPSVKAGIFRKEYLKGQSMEDPLLLNGEKVYTASGWDYDDKLTVPSFGVLKHIVEKYYGNLFKVEKHDLPANKVEFILKSVRGNGKSNTSTALDSYLTAIRTKPFLLLAGISGTGKSRIVRKLAQATDDIDTFEHPEDRWKLHSPSNFELIQVKPNWHNSMDVVGFKSNIGNGGEHYEFTPFVEFIAKAWKNEDTPFFLCLDEMNLAPVEEYFAEFLSAIESRSDNGGSYETDPIIKPFRDFGEKVAKDMLLHLLGENLISLDDDRGLSHVGLRFLNQGMTLPKNLIVMGTVNMDETTFSFSRKVLDRAMSIEMNEVMYDDFLAGKTENDIPQLTDRNQDLVVRPISGLNVKDSDSQSVINYLKDINDILKGTPFKLGYRAANEALLYVSAAKKFGCSNWKSAIDDFTLMKILSRIEGDDSKLKTEDGSGILDKLSELLVEKYAFDKDNSKTMIKLTQMANILDRDKFVSFWG